MIWRATRRSRRASGRARCRGEAGASLVEFALILPLFVMLMLGTITGGLAYNRQLAITAGAREGVRFAATRPGPVNAGWATAVARVVRTAADGELEADDVGRRICVYAQIPTSSPPIDQGWTFGSTDAASALPPGQPCFNDGLSGPRVQVVAQRTSTLEAMVFSRRLTLDFNAVSRYEG